MKALGLAWQLSSVTGWGIYGLNLAMELMRRGSPQPVLLKAPEMLQIDAIQAALLGPLVADQKKMEEIAKAKGPQQLSAPVLQALLPGFQPMSAGKLFRGTPDIGVIFFEDTRIGAEDLERAKRFKLIVCGSNWNTDICRGAGLTNVVRVWQGVDPVSFHAGPRNKSLSQRFVVFSGGKFEHRKAQDLVVAAFKAFHSRHADALLLASWHSPWPAKATTMSQSTHVKGVPALVDNGLQITPWLLEQGLPRNSFIDTGLVANVTVPRLLAESDCAVCVSRYESGTNLVAMEAMAMGLPVILSANTGHLDVLGDEHCYPVRTMNAVPPPREGTGTDGWGEASVDEIVEQLEAIYQNREAAAARGARAAELMTNFSWKKQVNELIEALDKVL